MGDTRVGEVRDFLFKKLDALLKYDHFTTNNPQGTGEYD